MPNALTISLSGVDITTNVDMTTVVMQLAGSQETATCEFDIIDTANSISATDEATLTVTEVSSATVLFGGFVRSRRITVLATGRIIHILATDYNSLLDRAIVVSDKRVAGESDKARLTYLMTTYGPQFSSDYTKITTLTASMVAQKFVALTLRQAIERVLGQASTKSSYFVDPTGRLNTYDRTVVTAAPFNVRVGTPLGGELAPDEFSVDNDASNLANAIYIVGATAAGSGWFTDTTSISTYGRRERFFNAPDADTAAKAKQLGLAVLADQKNPVPRGAFTTSSPNDGWRIGQSITITSTQHGLAGVSYRIARVTVHYLSGAGDREYSIEVGAPQVSMPALLAAAHGGGGGFPWLSPGGTGGWGPVVGNGTTGGGISGGGDCACNTPYRCVRFDGLNRVNANGWGTSDYGITYTYSGTQSDWTIDGANGKLTWTSGLPNIIAASPGPWDQDDWTFGTVFKTGNFTYLGTDGYAQIRYQTDVRIIYIEPGSNFGFGSPHGLIEDDNGGLYAIDFHPLTWYNLKWHQVRSTGMSEVKVWALGSPEPAFQLSSSIGVTSAPSEFRIRGGSLGSGWGAGNPYVQLWDYLEFCDTTAPNSGQPYPWTALGVGNTVITAFTALTPFRPGSLEVRVGSNTVTPISQDPVSGGFVLPFAPSASETIWAKWVTA